MADAHDNFVPERSRTAAAGGTVPIIDIAPFLSGKDSTQARAVVDAVANACEKIGFLVIVGHSVPPAAIDAVMQQSDRFFTRPADEKMKIKRPGPGVSRGYNGFADQALAQTLGAKTPPDLMESLGFGPLAPEKGPYWEEGHAPTYFHPNLWPDGMPEFKEAVSRYYQHMEGLAAGLFRIFALALGKDETFFRDKIDRHISRCGSITIRRRRRLRYPVKFVPARIPTMMRSPF